MRLAVFDIGGTAVKYGLWSENQLSQVSQFETPATFEELTIEMRQVAEDFDYETLTGIAISAPGAVNIAAGRIDGISAVSYLHQRPIFAELTAALGLPIAIANDANCAGIAEIEAGAGKEATNAVFVVLGTGVGGAIFIDRKLYPGAHLFGGEFGLMKSFGSTIFSQNGTLVKAVNFYREETGQKIDGRKLYRLSEAGDPVASRFLMEMYQIIAANLYNIQVALDPELIIFGGGVSARPELVPEVSQRLQTLLTDEGVGEIMPEIVNCQYHNDANLIGAAFNFIHTQAE